MQQLLLVNLHMFMVLNRFVLDICRTEAGDEMKEDIYKIPLLVPKVIILCHIFLYILLHYSIR